MLNLIVHAEGFFEGAPRLWLKWASELLQVLSQDDDVTVRLVVDELYIDDAVQALVEQGRHGCAARSLADAVGRLVRCA